MVGLEQQFPNRDEERIKVVGVGQGVGEAGVNQVGERSSKDGEFGGYLEKSSRVEARRAGGRIAMGLHFKQCHKHIFIYSGWFWKGLGLGWDNGWG